MRTVARTAVVGLTMLAVTAGCGSMGGSTPEPDPTDVALYDPTGGPGGFAARLAGVLDRVDGCVVVRGDGLDMPTDREFVPVFPSGVHWDGDALVVGDTTYRLGEHVELGGGVLAEQGAAAPTGVSMTGIPAACAGRALWLVSDG